MPTCSATRRASYTSSSEQQRPWVAPSVASFRQPSLVPELHRHAYDRIALAHQECGHGGTVDSAAHRDGDGALLRHVRKSAEDELLTRSKASASASTCSAVLLRPREMRRLARALSAVSPSAVSTCDGVIAPEEQADPVETAKPRRSQRNHHGLAIHAVEADVGGVGRTVPAAAVHGCAGDMVENRVFQPVAQTGSGVPIRRQACGWPVRRRRRTRRFRGRFPVPGRRSRS